MPFKKNDSKGFQQPIDVRKIFVGRTNELLFFIHNILEPEDPTHNIISVSGQGGVGKSTLLNRFINETRATNFKDYCLTAMVDERYPTPSNIMERLAEQLRETGYPLKNFEVVLMRYKEAIRRTQAAREVEQEILLRETVGLAGKVAEDVPFVGKLIQHGANTATELLLDKAHTHQFLKDATRLEDPISDLTKAFVKDLNQLAETQTLLNALWAKRRYRIILFFDNFEQLALNIVPWLQLVNRCS